MSLPATSSLFSLATPSHEDSLDLIGPFLKDPVDWTFLKRAPEALRCAFGRREAALEVLEPAAHPHIIETVFGNRFIHGS